MSKILPYLIIFELFVLTRHSSITLLTPLLGPLALILTIINFKYDKIAIVTFPFLAYLLMSLVYSTSNNINLDDSLRYFTILVLTLLIFFFKEIRPNLNYLLFPLIIQSCVVVGISLYLTLVADPVIAGLVRTYVLQNSIGDIYTLNGYLYKVQIIGNGLLPLLFFVYLFKHSLKYRWPVVVISFISLICAGNLTYIVVSLLALIVKYWKKIADKLLYLLIFISTLLPFVVITISELVSEKADSSSMGVRVDQIETAYNFMSGNIFYLLFGGGLGHRFPDGNLVNYFDSKYIELQSLYIILQIGLVGMLIYFLTIYIMCKKFLSKTGVLLFFLYVATSITNPYIFDTNQIMATIIVLCFFGKKIENENSLNSNYV